MNVGLYREIKGPPKHRIGLFKANRKEVFCGCRNIWRGTGVELLADLEAQTGEKCPRSPQEKHVRVNAGQFEARLPQFPPQPRQFPFIIRRCLEFRSSIRSILLERANSAVVIVRSLGCGGLTLRFGLMGGRRGLTKIGSPIGRVGASQKNFFSMGGLDAEEYAAEVTKCIRWHMVSKNRQLAF